MHSVVHCLLGMSHELCFVYCSLCVVCDLIVQRTGEVIYLCANYPLIAGKIGDPCVDEMIEETRDAP
jgi:hypothetical protein